MQTPAKILFFTPEALVTPHLGAQCILARTLQERGAEVLFVRCLGSLARCPSKDMVSAPFEVEGEAIQAVCYGCVAESLRYLNHYGLPVVSLSDYLVAEDVATIDDALAQAPSDLCSFEFENIPFGKVCVRDLSLSTKVCDFHQLDQSHRMALLVYLHGALTSYCVTKRILARHGITHLVRFNEYSTNLGAAFAAYRAGVRVLTTSQASHRGVDRRHLVVMSDLGPFTQRAQMNSWPQWEKLYLSPAQMAQVGDDIVVRCGAQSSMVFSHGRSDGAARHISELGLSYTAKTVVAFTSSLDEEVACRQLYEAVGRPIPMINKPFADQQEWLEALVEYVEARPDLQLIVRVHPREGANRRGGGGSQHLMQLRARFGAREYARCRFVWPESPISSYDLIELADLGLTSWSTIGLEMARLGVPVVAAWHDVSFPNAHFLPWGGETREQYFAAVDKQLARGLDPDQIKQAFRCYHQMVLMRAVEVNDLVTDAESSCLVDFKTPREAALLEQAVLGNLPLIELNLNRMRAQQDAHSAAREHAEFLRQLERIVYYFCSGDAESGTAGVVCVDCADQHTPSVCESTQPACIVDGKTVVFYRDGARSVRFSPLVARMVRYLSGVQCAVESCAESAPALTTAPTP